MSHPTPFLKTKDVVCNDPRYRDRFTSIRINVRIDIKRDMNTNDFLSYQMLQCTNDLLESKWTWINGHGRTCLVKSMSKDGIGKENSFKLDLNRLVNIHRTSTITQINFCSKCGLKFLILTYLCGAS